MKLLTSHLNLSGSTIHSQRLQGYVQSLVYLPTQNIIVIHCGAHRHTYTECMAIYRMHLSLFLCAMLLSTWQKYSKLLQLLLCYSYDIWNEHKFWKAFYSSLLLKAFKNLYCQPVTLQNMIDSLWNKRFTFSLSYCWALSSPITVSKSQSLLVFSM